MEEDWRRVRKEEKQEEWEVDVKRKEEKKKLGKKAIEKRGKRKESKN